jgi:hypothetical protein
LAFALQKLSRLRTNLREPSLRLGDGNRWSNAIFVGEKKSPQLVGAENWKFD